MPELTDARKAWADAIYVERHRRRLKQSDVAEATGLDQSTVSNAERGEASDESYRVIADHYGITLPESA